MKSVTIALVLGGSFMATSTAESGEKEINRPNVILCMCDDLGWGDVGYNGNKIIKTPNLDKMASEGIRFDRFYAAAPVMQSDPRELSYRTSSIPYRSFQCQHRNSSS